MAPELEVVERIRAGIPTFLIARTMGTSVEMIEKTHGHLLPDAAEYVRGQLDEFDSRAYGRLSDTGEGQEH